MDQGKRTLDGVQSPPATKRGIFGGGHVPDRCNVAPDNGIAFVAASRVGCAASKKGKVFPYSLPSVGPGADLGVQAVSPQVTRSESRHIPSSSLPLLSARPAFTFVAFIRWRYL